MKLSRHFLTVRELLARLNPINKLKNKRMKKDFKWGIIGPGKIADKFALALAKTPGAKLHAVASRDQLRARRFSEKHQASKFYDSYAALANDTDLDAIYIATPHAFHMEQALLCLRNKIPVLCEKPMSVNLESTQAIIAAARESNTFLMEAMWTRFLPHIEKTLDLIKKDRIGSVKHIRADFGFVFPFDPKSRVFDLKLGGGSLLDVGVYPLFLTLLILGKPDEILSFAKLSSTGSDETTDAILKYHSGASASIFSSVITQTPLTAEIYGTKGVITLKRPWYKGTEIEIREMDTITKNISLPYGDNGFEFQILETMDCVNKGLKESPRMPHAFSLELSAIMDTICKQCHISYT
jgi:predicted dehydrogenase